ncbi:DUF1127 domain-containing protein [Azospirillum rugosum]|uniref:Uncharacterized protein YjiS (DUF1127 family) n=1 Tax=Azospirillum rugosum TaxID=416170 RepID=A0ABS4SIZ9_9PROT|nr:DUF1127 domain-containing protein [Azospirillum rugosum]MBP2292204.1 uncharacterized protein YjiS (DUF1127 family) [Azospirillum rugosum]MDQ0525963.1 uncharacterized protein YjiS (DUF1127 family) [Azospirillum rugosum]
MAIPVSFRPQPCRVPVAFRPFAWLARLWRRRQESAQLLSMTDRELRDIGITRYEALTEARKPFWR